jgi:hypothetical protein
MAALHPKVHELRSRRKNRASDTAVTWRELDLILDLLEITMAGVSDTEGELTQLEQDEAARDAANDKALSDLKDEVARIAAQHPEVDLSGVNSRINALDTTIKGKTTEAAAADPGAQQQPPDSSTPTQAVYTFDTNAEGAVADTRFSASGFETVPAEGAGAQELFYFSGDTAGQPASNANPAPGYVEYTGSVKAVPAS